VIVETPVKLTEEQRKLLEELKNTLDSNSKHSPRGKSWFDGVKSFFDELKP
jgi:molecular chaperone DnaJ